MNVIDVDSHDAEVAGIALGVPETLRVEFRALNVFYGVAAHGDREVWVHEATLVIDRPRTISAEIRIGDDWTVAGGDAWLGDRRITFTELCRAPCEVSWIKIVFISGVEWSIEASRAQLFLSPTRRFLERVGF